MSDITDKIIGLIEKLIARGSVNAERLRSIENRLATLDGGMDSKAAIAKAERCVAARRSATGKR